MEPLATLSPAVTEFDILVDMRLVEIDQVMTIPLCLGQQRTELHDKGLPPLGLGTPQQLSGLLPRQFKAVQGGADGLTAVEAGQKLFYPNHPAPQSPARRRVSPPSR